MSQKPRLSPELSVGIKRNNAQRNIKTDRDKGKCTLFILGQIKEQVYQPTHQLGGQHRWNTQKCGHS